MELPDSARILRPPIVTSLTFRTSPGSNRTACSGQSTQRVNGPKNGKIYLPLSALLTGSSGNVETTPQSSQTVESQKRIRLNEGVVGSDLNRPVARVGDAKGDAVAALVEDNRRGLGRDDEGSREMFWHRRRWEQLWSRCRKERTKKSGTYVSLGSTDGVVHRDQEGAVGEATLDHDLVEQLRDARQDMAPSQHCFPQLHELSDRMQPIANVLLEHRGNQCRRFRLVQFDAACQASLGQEARLGEEQLVSFSRQ